ncbi:carboxylating nicotinate-nucleotide diphosphorylase [Halobacillus salinarum]|uniref:nicotinate-nucleotide diphosphorylase (carboxylating) n=1 Tax=Halobacillus salinarum TaxID=2932257 RepID=A0ABY4EMJ4_9BACI|nr:carboxylating nicotinate-nucleotide diphosphorylase [Halobacillus salinarum]UOQ45078.1 carboxylating nicotinate-nucleotide diphosphorylase [Halobacillus salinarum]
MNSLKLKQMLEHFFIEDIGEHDVTSDLLFSKNDSGEIAFVAKQDGILCGGSIITTGFQLLDPAIEVTLTKKDGEHIRKGETFASAAGTLSSLLKGERVILNLLQRMSGISTLTNEAVKALNSSHTRICDTRKTTPGLRMLEKYAVRTGGGYNHRHGLYDAVMIKDNHIALAGSLTKAVSRIKNQIGHMVKIEVETETKDQVLEAVENKVDCIMFDNCTVEETRQFVQLVPPAIVTEASGGITIEQLPAYTNSGVDYISLGFLTHSVPSLDISVQVHTHVKGGFSYESI